MKKLLFICNPYAGKKHIVQRLHDVVYLFAIAGYEVTVHPTRRPCPLWAICRGTTNDFSKTLKLPADLMRAAWIAVEGVPSSCDVGAFNGRPFNLLSMWPPSGCSPR